MAVRIYTITTCPYCEKTVEFLASHGVEFEIVNLDELSDKPQAEAIAEAYRLTGQRSFPVVNVNGTGVVGYDVKRLTKLLSLPTGEQPLNPYLPKPIKDEETITKIKEWAEKMGYVLTPDKDLLNILLAGLSKNEKRYGYRSCPCRVATGDYDKDCDIICPCAYREADIAVYGRCYCGLYVSEEFIKKGDRSVHIPEARDMTTSETSAGAASQSGQEPDCDARDANNVPAPAASIEETIDIFAYLSGKDERDLLRDDFNRLAQILGIPSIFWHGETAEGSRQMSDHGNISLKFLQGMYEHIFMLWTSPSDIKEIYEEALDIFSGHLKDRPNELYKLKIIVGDLALYLPSKEVKGQRLSDGTIITSVYDSNTHVRKYSLLPADRNKAARLSDDIIRLETCYNLLLSQRQKYLLLADKLGRIEEGIATTMGIIHLNIATAEGHRLKEWLHFLSTNFTEVAGVTEELKRHAADTEARRSLLKTIIEKWGEEPAVQGGINISTPLWTYTSAIGDDYGRLISRIDGLKRELGDVINILRTRVDIIQQEQSLAIQKSMHETAQAQLKMQRAVESLEIFIGTYYMTELSRSGFNAVETQGIHLPYKPEVLAAALIPVFFVFAVFISGKLNNFFKAAVKRFREKKDG